MTKIKEKVMFKKVGLKVKVNMPRKERKNYLYEVGIETDYGKMKGDVFDGKMIVEIAAQQHLPFDAAMALAKGCAEFLARSVTGVECGKWVAGMGVYVQATSRSA